MSALRLSIELQIHCVRCANSDTYSQILITHLLGTNGTDRYGIPLGTVAISDYIVPKYGSEGKETVPRNYKSEKDNENIILLQLSTQVRRYPKDTFSLHDVSKHDDQTPRQQR